MAYSRPTNKGVNVRQQESLANTPSIIGSQPRATVSANGPLLDNRDPNQLLAAGNQRANEINKFLKFFQEDVTPVITQELDNRAKQAAGEVLDSFSGSDLLGDASPEAADAYRALSPRARDFVVEAAAVQGVASFGPALQAEITGGPDAALLQRPSKGNPELQAAQVEARARAIQTAEEKVGLSNVPAFTRLQYTPQLAQITGQADSGIYKNQINAQTKADKAAIVGDLSKRFQDAATLSLTQEQIDNGETAIAFTQTHLKLVTEALQNQFTTDDIVEIFASSIQTSILNTTDPDSRLNLLDQMQIAAKLPLEVNGINIWDARIGNSSQTVKGLLEQLEPGIQQEVDKDNQAQIVQAVYAAQQEGRWDEAEALMKTIPTMFEDPEMAVATFRQIQAMDFPNRAGQERNQQKAWKELADRLKDGEDKAVVLGDLQRRGLQDPGLYSKEFMENVGRLRVQAVEGDIKTADSADEDLANSINRGLGVNDPLIRNQAAATARVFENANLDDADRNQLADQIREKVGQRVRDRYKQLTPEEQQEFDFAEEIAKESKAYGEELRESIPDEYRAPVFGGESMAPVVSKLNNDLANSGGTLTPTMLPPLLIDSLVSQERNPKDMSERQLARALVDYLAIYQEKDGTYILTNTKEYKDIEKWVQQKLRDARKKAKPEASDAPARKPGFQSGRDAPGMGVQQVEDIEFAPTNSEEAKALQQEIIQEAEKQRKEGVKDYLGDQVSNFTNSALSLIAGGPANAATFDNPTREAIAALNRSMTGGGRVTASDPPQRQLAATSPAKVQPTRITPNHDFMIAIGISEGTRTANGGYTKNWSGHGDPGDKNTNVGTISFSAARFGYSLTPAQADLKYSQMMTNTVLKMTPVLQRLGLKRNSQGFNRVMYNILDLEIQSPLAAKDFIYKLGAVKRGSFSIEAIAKQRAESFRSPTTGRLDAPGFGNNYSRLLKDQRARAGSYDYKARL